MGTDVRLLAPDSAGLDDAREWLASFDARLSRFREDSELCALNRDAARAVPASALLRTAVSAGLWAARRTGGLVDPTVLPALRSAGYADSLAGVAPAGLAAALAAAPPRRGARPHPARAGAACASTTRTGIVAARPGSSSTAAGPARASRPTRSRTACAHGERFAVDCGGDLRVGGDGAQRRPMRSRSRTRSAASPSTGCGWAPARSPPRASTPASGSGPTGPSRTTSSTR